MSLVLDAVWSNLTDQPFNIEFAVTHNCNSKCVMCDQWKHESQNELTLNEIARIFGSYQNFKVIGITGGEPTLREDLSEIIRTINLLQPNLKRLFLTTNGFLTKKTVSDVQSTLKLFDYDGKHPLLTVLVSVDGPKYMHNRIRGVKTAYDSATETIKQLNVLRENYTFNLGVIATYSPFNFREYPLVLEEVQALTDTYDLEPAFCVVWHGELYKLKEDFDHEYLAALLDMRKGIQKVLRSTHSNLINARSLFFDLAEHIIEHPEKQVIPCAGAKARYYLNAHGDLFPCVVWSKEIGNLHDYDYDLNRIFASHKRFEVRSLIEKNKCQICYITCELIPSMMTKPFRTLLALL